MNRWLRCAALGAFAALAACASEPTSAGVGTAPLRVVSFNIRYGTANDGEDRWELRRELVIDTIRDLDADLLGLQEALDFQVHELHEAFPRYRVIGVGRGPDGTGERACLFVDVERFEVRESGDFWLSLTPDLVASKGWDAALPRICSWAVLRDRENGTEFVWMNTHFDHRGELSRERSAALVVNRLAERPDLPAIVTGDLNADEESAALVTLRGAGLRDTYRVLHPEATESGTFTGFRSRAGPSKIDYVLCSDEWDVLEAGIDRRGLGGRLPSDHFPVMALVRSK
jgi:endonuclease/exonuclease/phosphatase family metal-dependent hydrolase